MLKIMTLKALIIRSLQKSFCPVWNRKTLMGEGDARSGPGMTLADRGWA